MADSVPIVPGLTFPEQVHELATFFGRALPTDEAREAWINEVSNSLRESEEGIEVSEEKRQKVVEIVVKGVVDSNGAVTEGTEREAESSHLLLHALLASTFGAESDAFAAQYKQILASVVRGSEKAGSSSSSKIAMKSETGFKILTNAYNMLPISSPLRPATLLELLRVLSASTVLDLSALPLSTPVIEQAVSEWSTSTADKVAFLRSVAEIYESDSSVSVSRTASLKQALEFRILALHLAEDKQGAVDEVIAKAVSIPDVFEVSDVLRVQGAREALSEEGKMVVRMLETDEVELEEGLKWVESSKSALEAKGIQAASFSNKLRLLALMTLCSRSESREIPYAKVASALHVDAKQVESVVIDAIRLNLLKARLSQPKQTLQIQSVHSRSFSSSEWQLLDRRLGEWKQTVDEVRSVVEDAIAKAAQAEQEAGRGGAAGQRQRRERRDGQQREQQGQEQQQQRSAPQQQAAEASA